MTLSKKQILDNLVKYRILSQSIAKSYTKCKKENLLKLLNNKLPKQVVLQIYDEEFASDKEKDYTPLDTKEIQELKDKYSFDKTIYNNFTNVNKQPNHVKNNIQKLYNENNAKINDSMIKKVLNRIEELY